jgi:hypothetical protein
VIPHPDRFVELPRARGIGHARRNLRCCVDRRFGLLQVVGFRLKLTVVVFPALMTTFVLWAIQVSLLAISVNGLLAAGAQKA